MVSSHTYSGAGISSDKAGQPLYRKVANVLRDEIISGIYPVGNLLPTEDKLCERFSVSRHTVREAMRLLREDNLVSSRRGSGTVVVAPSTADADIHQVMSINDLVAFAKGLRFDIESIDTIAIDRKLARHTGLEKGGEWLQVVGYRYAEGEDFATCRTEYYINRSFAAVGRILRRHSGPIFELIEDMFGQQVEEVRQQISATLLSADLAASFGVEDQSAALEVRRTYQTTDRTIAQLTINTHPAERFQHSMTMRRIRS